MSRRHVVACVVHLAVAKGAAPLRTACGRSLVGSTPHPQGAHGKWYSHGMEDLAASWRAASVDCGACLRTQAYATAEGAQGHGGRRKGAGRPPTPASERYRHISVWLHREAREALERGAEAAGKPRARFLVDLVRQAGAMDPDTLEILAERVRASGWSVAAIGRPMSASMPREVLEDLDRMAAAHGMARSAMVAVIVGTHAFPELVVACQVEGAVGKA